MKLEIELTSAARKRKHIVEIERKGNTCTVSIDGQFLAADAIQVSSNSVSVLVDGQAFEIHISRAADGTLKLQSGPHEFSADVVDPRAWKFSRQCPAKSYGSWLRWETPWKQARGSSSLKP
jgi:hypothetical protein